MPKITVRMSTFPQSRLGNGLFQLLFMTMLKEECGMDIVLPRRADSPVRMLESDVPSTMATAVPVLSFMPDDESRVAGPERDMALIQAFASQHGAAEIDIYGFFQYHTAHFRRNGRPALVRELFSPTQPAAKFKPTQFKQVLADNVRALDHWLAGRQLLALHVRRGDYVALQASGRFPMFFGASMAAIIQHIQSAFTSSALRDVVVYLCSDDLPHCTAELGNGGITTLCANHFFPPGSASADTLLALDFAAMVRADFLIAANSSLSIFAALLNETGKYFMRPDPLSEGLMPFHPWNTPVLCSKMPQAKA